MPDAHPKPTAAEVLAAHQAIVEPEWARCDTCGVLDVSTVQHQEDMLAAAGRLATPEHMGPCPTPCDEGCPSPCHEDHQVLAKREHAVETCSGSRLAEHDAQVLRDAAREFDALDAPDPWYWSDSADLLRDRADWIARGEP